MTDSRGMKNSNPSRFYGNGPYCYSNSTSMLLSTIGESIPPSLVEPLTGVGLGAFWLAPEKLLFFSNLSNPPDIGVTKALRLLGFDFEEKASTEKENPPFDTLRNTLDGSPAILGPLDMGYLPHNPLSKRMLGSDHFVLAYDMDADGVWVNDPEGFPNVKVPFKWMEKAWRAEGIGYRRGYYRYWARPRRVQSPSEDEIYDNAVKSFREAYRESEEASKKSGWAIGKEAIEKLANQVRTGPVKPPQRGFMVFFSLKLGARRALDYAGFFRPRDRHLAELKMRQAKTFGRAQANAVDRKWKDLGMNLEELALLEGEFRKSLFQ